MPWGFLVAVMGIGVIFCMQRFGVRVKVAYLAAGVVVWAGTYCAGEVSGGSATSVSRTVSIGVAVGLLLGKPAGIRLASWLTLRFRLGILPTGIGARHLVVLGVVAGIGFTMSLFVSQLTFSDTSLMSAAKLGVLAGSGGAAVL